MTPSTGSRTLVDWDDTTYLHAAAAGHGFRCVVAANGTLVVTTNDGRRSACLAQGVLPTTSQATAALLGEQDLAREVLRRAGIPTPVTQAHGFKDGIANIVRAAQSLGYPMTVRPVWVTRRTPTSSRAIPVTNKKELTDAINALQTAAGRRAGRRALPHGRLMVERRPSEGELHALVIEDEILAATHESSAGETGFTYRIADVSTLSPDLCDTIRATARAVPGLPMATVNLAVVDDLDSIGTRPHTVTALDIYPRLVVHERAAAEAGIHLAGMALNYAMTGQTAPAKRAKADVAVCLQVSGVANARASLEALNNGLGANELAGSLKVDMKHADRVHGDVSGAPAALARFVRSLVCGDIRSVRPLYVEHG